MQTSQIYDLLPTRKKADLADYFSGISPEERRKVKYICMDMYQLLKHFNWVLTKSSSRLDLHETVDLRRYFYAFDSQYPSIGVMIEKMSSFDFDLTAAYSMKEEYAYINSTSTP